ncbi:hypothetical protein X739_11895 [Mesorhizobium sp. LNHC220B00]|nr:hypothetical protein X739_11895 [Mesorhizobium sp. LNHC220B00]
MDFPLKRFIQVLVVDFFPDGVFGGPAVISAGLLFPFVPLALNSIVLVTLKTKPL